MREIHRKRFLIDKEQLQSVLNEKDGKEVLENENP